MYWIASLLFFSVISSPIVEVVIKETSWANIVEFVQIFKHLNKLPSKSPFNEANEFQDLEPLLVAMVSGLCDHICGFSLYSLYYIYISS